MKYFYRATQADGKVVESEMDAENLQEVLRYLSSAGLQPVNVKPVKRLSASIDIFGSKITLTDQIFIFRYLNLMLGIGTNLLQAINILIEDFDKKSVKNFLIEVRANLEKGNPFYTVFAKYEKIFSPITINLIKAGEVSGNLQSVTGNISDSLIKEKGLKDEVRSALIYPILLLSVSVFILIFLVTFALPRIAGVFLESGFEPPIFSKIVFTVGLFLGKIWFWLLGLVVILAVALFYLYKTSLVFRSFVWNILISMPIVKDILEKRAIQRFAATTSSLVKAGIAITDALEISAGATGYVEMRNALIRISQEGLAKGLTLGDAFRREPVFPKIVVNLIAIAERAGHVEDVLATLSDFYIGEIDNAVKRLVSFLEPMLLLMIGFVIGVIALAIIVPIYQLTTSF